MQAVPAEPAYTGYGALPARGCTYPGNGAAGHGYTSCCCPFFSRISSGSSVALHSGQGTCTTTGSVRRRIALHSQGRPEIPVIPGGEHRAAFSALGFGGVSGQSAHQGFNRRQRHRRCKACRSVHHGRALHRDAQTGDHAFQGHALALLAGVLPQKICCRSTRRWAGSRRCCKEQILLQYRNIVQTHSANSASGPHHFIKRRLTWRMGSPLSRSAWVRPVTFWRYDAAICEDGGRRRIEKVSSTLASSSIFYGADLNDLAPQVCHTRDS